MANKYYLTAAGKKEVDMFIEETQMLQSIELNNGDTTENGYEIPEWHDVLDDINSSLYFLSFENRMRKYDFAKYYNYTDTKWNTLRLKYGKDFDIIEEVDSLTIWNKYIGYLSIQRENKDTDCDSLYIHPMRYIGCGDFEDVELYTDMSQSLSINNTFLKQMFDSKEKLLDSLISIKAIPDVDYRII